MVAVNGSTGTEGVPVVIAVRPNVVYSTVPNHGKYHSLKVSMTMTGLGFCPTSKRDIWKVTLIVGSARLIAL
jgi:hypothetical protein